MIPVLLCGGSGSRLWPILKKKSFYNFFGKDNLLDMSLKRLKDFEPILMVSVEELKKNLEETLKEKKYKTEIIYEPEPKGTAVAIALACHSLIRNKGQAIKEEIIGIFPSDHFIERELEFKKLISMGVQLARTEQKIITFGIPPSAPSCLAYGYITVEKSKQMLIKKAVGFVEKPTRAQYIALLKGEYFWNSGIFLSPLKLLIQCFERYLPHLWKQILCLKDNSIQSIYKNLDIISFDKAVMENIKQHFCINCDVGWSDLGSWDRIAEWDQKFPGKLNNKAFTTEKDSKTNFIFSSEDKTVGLIGVTNSLIINEKNSLLVAKKGQSENVKLYYKEFQKQKKEWVEKPWGAYRVILENSLFKYKELKIKPGHQLSYQSHKKRKEHWLVIDGQAEVFVDDVKRILQTNEHTFIDQGVKHRLKNSTNQMLLVLEIQIGAYLEEDDIVRYQDDYGRI